MLSRAAPGQPDDASIFRAGPLTIDLRKRQALLDGQVLDLTPTEFRLLALLGRQAGRAVAQEELLREMWGEYREQGDSALRRYVWLLRQKIEVDPNAPQRLVTVRGYGYRLES